MLGSWNRKTRHGFCAIVVLKKHDAGDSVRSKEIDQVCGAADRGSFFRTHATIAEIVQLERQQRWVARPFKKSANDLLDFPRKGCDGGRIPDFQKQSLKVIG